MSEIAELCLSGATLPGRLTDLSTPPERLFLRGELPRGPSVALVGTRKPSREYANFARKLAHDLAAGGVTVLSGGALGIDSEAHGGALDAGGVTVVVAPAGFNRPFPEQNAELFRRVVASRGAYLSLVEADTPAHPSRFFLRNACLVALAHLVVVVEAPFRSGARNAAAHARRLGRPVYAVPAAPWHANGRGCLLELQLGARPLITVKDLFAALRDQNLHALEGPPPAQQSLWPMAENTIDLGTSEPGRRAVPVLDAVRWGAQTVDEICNVTGLPAAQVSELILTLRLEGVLVTDPSGRLQIHNNLK